MCTRPSPPSRRPRMLDQLPTRRRRMRLLAQALDQPQAPTRLELANLQADRGLREVEAPRRGGKTAERRHLGQGPQLVKVETAHVKEPLIDAISKSNLLLWGSRSN